MFSCTKLELIKAWYSLQEQYPDARITRSRTLGLLEDIHGKLVKRMTFPYALRESLNKSDLQGEERTWYKAFAGAFYGARGGKKTAQKFKKKNPKARKRKKTATKKKKSRISEKPIRENRVQGFQMELFHLPH